MAYDGPRTKYAFPVTNAALNFAIRGPKGKAGLLYDYGVQGVTTALAGGPHILIGTAADDDAYGDEFDLGAVAVTTSKSLRSTYYPSEAGWATYMVNRKIPADTDVRLGWIAGSAGVGTAFVEIIWAT